MEGARAAARWGAVEPEGWRARHEAPPLVAANVSGCKSSTRMPSGSRTCIAQYTPLLTGAETVRTPAATSDR